MHAMMRYPVSETVPIISPVLYANATKNRSDLMKISFSVFPVCSGSINDQIYDESATLVICRVAP